MVAPLVLVGVGLAGGWAWRKMNKATTKNEQEGKQLLADAKVERERIIKSRQEQKHTLLANLAPYDAHAQEVIRTYTERDKPIFQAYGHATMEGGYQPPQGYELVERITIPPRIEYEIEEERPNTDTMFQYRNRHLLAITMAFGLDWLAEPALRLKDDISGRKKAGAYLQKVRNAGSDNVKLQDEDEINKSNDMKVLARAALWCEKLDGLYEFFKGYAPACEEYLKQGKTRQTLTDEEYINVQHLARIRISITEHVRTAMV